MPLSPILVQRMARAYGLGLCDQPRKIDTHVWKLTSETGALAVKYFVPGQTRLALREATVLRYLCNSCDQRIRVPGLLTTRAGHPTLALPEAVVMLTHWVAGRYKTYKHFTDNDWAALGRTLGALHRRLEGLSMTAMPTLHRRLHRIDPVEEHARIEAARERMPDNSHFSVKQVHAYLDTRKRLFDECFENSLDAFPRDDPQAPIHNDFNQFNYLFNAKTPPLILDWAAVIGAPREYEVVRCLNHLPLESPDKARLFLEAYLREHPLDSRRMGWAVDTARLMHARKHWLIEAWLAGQSGMAKQLSASMAIMMQLAEARAALVHFFKHVTEHGG